VPEPSIASRAFTARLKSTHLDLTRIGEQTATSGGVEVEPQGDVLAYETRESCAGGRRAARRARRRGGERCWRRAKASSSCTKLGGTRRGARDRLEVLTIGVARARAAPAGARCDRRSPVSCC
jgi:hypothetical protein